LWLLYLLANRSVGLNLINRQAARIVMGGKHMRAGNVGGDIDCTCWQQCGLTVREQGAGRWVDLERGQTALAISRRLSVRAHTAITPGHVKIPLRRMLNSFLDTFRECNRTAFNQGRTIEIDVILREFLIYRGIQDRSAAPRCFAYWLAIIVATSKVRIAVFRSASIQPRALAGIFINDPPAVPKILAPSDWNRMNIGRNATKIRQ
jgi:hypothetical protein